MIRKHTAALFQFFAIPFALLMPGVSLAAGAAGPFATGTAASSGAILTILTPIAVIATMAAAILAMMGKISWSWLIGLIVGIVLLFGAPQIVAWVRGLFGV